MTEKIKTKRVMLGVTLQQLSNETGISPTELSRIERGKRNATTKTLCNICEVLGLELRIVESKY